MFYRFYSFETCICHIIYIFSSVVYILRNDHILKFHPKHLIFFKWCVRYSKFKFFHTTDHSDTEKYPKGINVFLQINKSNFKIKFSIKYLERPCATKYAKPDGIISIRHREGILKMEFILFLKYFQVVFSIE